MNTYNHTEIENKWKIKWYDSNLYEAVDFSDKPKKYILAEFPYPSGKALHAGHMMRFTLPDVYSRYLRMKGYNVLFPMGWDAFGLPAENYAVKTGINPAISTKEIIGHYKDSLLRMGYGIDLNREIATTDPKYYKWTQWIFLKFLKAGLAEYREMPIWWCETLRTVLADEEVLTDKDGNKISERGEYPVERKMFKQWVLKMPEYAEKLLDGLHQVDFTEAIKTAQANWIGKMTGLNITYKIKDTDKEVTVFTTRPDTNFGATFIVLAPEHELASQIATPENKEAVDAYIARSKNRSDLERLTEVKDKTGAFTGRYAINNLNKDAMPIYIADYVLANVGTGAVVGVPGHDRRDFEFAKAFGLPVKRVIVGESGDTSPIETVEQIVENGGTIINSDFINGLPVEEAIEKVTKFAEEQGWGKPHVSYRLRDWVFSRQRYWGEPIPVLHTEDGKIEAICDPDDPQQVRESLPLVLPEVPDYNPTSDGSSPLDRNKEWVNTTDKNGKPAKRETNTMPNWAGSSWYYLRYIDPKNDNKFADYSKLKYWLPVDRYFGGAEHTTLHLLYSRFWHKFLYDQGLVPTPEPYAWRINGGLLLGPDGKKMSKSKGNVIEPMELVENFGADSLRMFICFLGPYEDTYPWNDNGMKATSRLTATIYSLKDKVKDNITDEALLKKYNIMVKHLTSMLEDLKMNTAISEIMIFVNELKTRNEIDSGIWKGFIRTLAPFAPFLAEELWAETNKYTDWTKENSVHTQAWPTFDDSLTKEQEITVPVQVNGKVRSEVQLQRGADEAAAKIAVMANERISALLADKEIKKFIYVPDKIINIVL